MPELPEVTVVVNALKQLILNKKIKNIQIFKEKMIKEISVVNFKTKLIGRTIKKISNHGKFIVFHFDKNTILISHLRMEGKYFYYKKHENPIKHIHLIFMFDDGSELQYMDTRIFGTFHIRDEEYLNILPLSKLAKEPKDTNANYLHKKLKRKKIAIKTALLDQTLLVGLGNIYIDEVLFASKINPQKKSNMITLRQTKEILKNASLILQKAIECGGSSISSYASVNWKFGTYQKYLKVHTRKGENCVDCFTPVSKIKVNGRGTYYCTKCQNN